MPKLKNHTTKLLKTTLLLMCFGMMSLGGRGQTNLVPNYSFENYIICPSNLGLAAPPPPWHLTTNQYIAVYANACSTNPMFTVPVNSWGAASYQYAHTGNGYVGADFFHYPGISFGRIYIQTKLTDSLNNSHRYYVEFYVSLTNSSQYACNNVAIGLSKNAIWQDTLANPIGVLSFATQIYNYGNPIITDTMNWVKVSAIYKAQGGEQYLTFGNFKKDNQTNYLTVYPSVNTSRAVYYLDDVSVIPLDSFCLKADAGKDTAISLGDSVFIGSLTNGIDSIKWLNGNTVIDSIRPGFWVHLTVTTSYILQQVVNGCFSADTIVVTVNSLPLKILNYELRMMNEKQIENKWVTANEVNVSHFNIQRSVNTKDFINIGKVSANNKNYNEYSFIDDVGNLEFGIRDLYYKLEMVDKDGIKTYSQIQQINFQHQTLFSFLTLPKTSLLLNVQELRNY